MDAEPEEYARREESDFLAPENHEGEFMDFHCLRHTCGAWLAMTGAHPKVVQTVMRHSSITLTMDTYGHLFPGQEADAVAKMREMLLGLSEPPESDPANAEHGKVAQRQTQQSGRDGVRQQANNPRMSQRKQHCLTPSGMRT